MNRRSFLQQTVATGSLLGLQSSPVVGAAAAGTDAWMAQPATKRTFRLKYAPHFGMFKNSAGEDLIDQLHFMADNGFTAMEDNSMMARPVDVQQKIGDTMARLGMTMGVFVIDGGDNWKVSLATGKPEFKEAFVKTCRTAVDVAKRVNTKWATVVPGYFARELPIGIQTGHVIDALRAGADVLAPANLTMVIESLSDNPDLFLRTSDQGYMMCRAINSPACKMLFDMYHMQRNEGRMIEHIDWAWNEIGYFQIGDVPGRKEPTTGEMNYKNIFKHIHERATATQREFVLGAQRGEGGCPGDALFDRAELPPLNSVEWNLRERHLR
jgi:hydroxypyruvate isomerase